MKTAVVFTALLASAAAFAPAPQGRPSTAVQETFFNKVFGMDLFAPNPDVNTYGARDKKNVSWQLRILNLNSKELHCERCLVVWTIIVSNTCGWFPLFSILQLKVGKIGDSSYVPSGLTAAEYNKVREQEAAKKAANYKKNVAKAGKFLDYTDFYTKRGTDKNENWFKSVTRGHDMAKTKYDWSGTNDAKGYDGKK